MNLRPSGYEPDELPDCSTPRQYAKIIKITKSSQVNLKKIFFSFSLFFLIETGSAKSLNYKNKTAPSQIKLVSPYQAISKQKKKIPIGLWITLDKGWHSYWQNPGESGKELKAKWTLPEGSVISHLNWPIPERLKFGSFTNFVYKNHFLLISELFLPVKELNPQINITAQVEWFVCEKVCIPLSREVQLNLNVRETEKIDSYWQDMFDKWSVKIPKTLNKKIPLQEETTNWRIDVSTEKKLTLSDILPFSKEDFSPKKPVILSTKGYQHSALIKPIDTVSSKNKQQRNIQGLLVFEDKNNKQGFIYTFTHNKKGVLWFLLFAFLGGLILNFMPCVLPIVFLKFSNTLELSKEKKSKLISSNIFYSIGVIFSFMILAFLIVLLKKGGDSIGWGFQMQSPYFLTGITFLFFLISFSFMGWFSLTIPSLPFFHQGTTLFKHFLTGILSTTAASPCTVPFMGAAMGYAFSGNTFQIALIFLFLGLGLSFPYLLLSVFPKWMQYVPAPGGWSNKLKHFMAFPMLATCIWLIHLFNKQEPESLLVLLFSLLFLSLGFWFLNNLKAGKYLKWLFRIIILISLTYPFLHLYQGKEPTSFNIQWETFSIGKMEKIRSEGQPLFINFTAEWCLTCKFNEQITFKNKKVIQFFKDKQIHSLKGDWTHKNPEISAILRRYNRSGIPFYLYFPPESPAIVLPEILTPHILFKNLNKK